MHSPLPPTCTPAPHPSIEFTLLTPSPCPLTRTRNTEWRFELGVKGSVIEGGGGCCNLQKMRTKGYKFTWAGCHKFTLVSGPDPACLPFLRLFMHAQWRPPEAFAAEADHRPTSLHKSACDRERRVLQKLAWLCSVLSSGCGSFLEHAHFSSCLSTAFFSGTANTTSQAS